MGDLRRGNGGGSPPEDGGAHPDDLPDLPAEWGAVVIPDDPAELADEADALRRELRRAARGPRIGSAAIRRPSTEPKGVGLALVVMSLAILTTLVSLFLVTWQRRPAPPHPTTATPAKITEYALMDAAGHPVPLASLMPAVILLVDGCDCAGLIKGISGAAPVGVRVVAVARDVPVIPGAPGNVVTLADPEGLLRARFAASATPTSDAATALLVRPDGMILATVPGVRVVGDLGDLGRLTA